MQDKIGPTELRQGFVLPSLDDDEASVFLAALSESVVDAQKAGLLFHVERTSLAIRPFLPHWNSQPRAPQKLVTNLRNRIGLILAEELNRHVDLSRTAAQTVDIVPMTDITGALIIGIYQAAQAEADQTNSANLLVAMVGNVEDMALPVSEVVRRTRYSALSVFKGDTDPDLVIARVDGASDGGATLDGLRAGTGNTLPVLAPVETSAGFVWLPDNLTVAPDRRVLVASMLNGLRETGALKGSESLLLLPEPTGDIVWTALPDLSVDDQQPEHQIDRIPETALRIEKLQVVPSNQAHQDLQNRIADIQFPLGYRVHLDPIPETTVLERDVEILREEIAERESEIELIRALSAPQLRLLRFTDAQLPALVDALSRMPPAMFRNADLRYAAAHAAGRAEPAHFLLYDPADLALEGFLRENTWRGQTEDHPIRYWLDPHSAQAMDRDNSHILVFAPVRHRLLPAIDSFGGRLGETLGLIMGNLFADASTVLDAPGAEPIFVFSPATLSGADMDVELLDRIWFEPVHLALKWINDYMVVRAPRVTDRESLARLAEDLYEGDFAAKIHANSDNVKAAMTLGWEQAEAEIQAQIDSVVQHVASEIDKSADHLQLGRAFLLDAQKRIDDMDTLIAEMKARVADADWATTDIADIPSRLMGERYELVADLMAEIAAGDRALEEATARVEAQRDRISALMERLKYL